MSSIGHRQVSTGRHMTDEETKAAIIYMAQEIGQTDEPSEADIWTAQLAFHGLERFMDLQEMVFYRP